MMRRAQAARSGAQGADNGLPGQVIRLLLVLAEQAGRTVPRRLADERRGLVVADQVMQGGDEPADGVHDRKLAGAGGV